MNSNNNHNSSLWKIYSYILNSNLHKNLAAKNFYLPFRRKEICFYLCYASLIHSHEYSFHIVHFLLATVFE